MPVEVENLDRDIAVIRKRRGQLAIRKASERPPTKFIPLDSPALMRITGGGIALGRTTRLWGQPSSGKTLIALQIVKAAQQFRNLEYMSGFKCCFWDVEGTFDEKFAKELGVDNDLLEYQDAHIIEDIANEISVLLGSVHVHVLDSCSEAIPQERLQLDASEERMGGSAKSWKKAINYINNAMNDENAIIMIEHEGKDFKSGVRKPLGGKDLEHLASVTLQLTRGAWLFYDDEEMLQTADKLKDKSILGIEGKKEADGIEFIAQATKNKVRRPGLKQAMRFDFKKLEFDHSFELLTGAEYYDKNGGLAHRTGQPPIAQKSGSWYSLPDGRSKIQGQRQLRQAIEQDEELQKMIRKAMLVGN